MEIEAAEVMAAMAEEIKQLTQRAIIAEVQVRTLQAAAQASAGS
ncbi:hypothetical protein [Leucobacter sp. G161]|nr:hypothetical protein [Leucobacter sp. G161]